MKRLTDSLPLTLAALVAGAVAAALLVPSNYIGGLVLLSAIYALLGLSVNLIYGYLGYTSFGHAAFVGLGAYTAVLVSSYAEVSFWLAAAFAIIPGILLGIVVAFASLRISGVYFAVTSLTLAEILRLVAENWIGLTNGPAGLTTPRPDVGGLRALGFSYQESLIVITVTLVGVCFLALRRLLTTPTGRAWAAIRAGQDLSESLGIQTFRYRVLNVGLSGALGALAGALLMPKILVATPELLSPHYSAIGLLIVVLGGRRSLWGPIIGGTLFACLPEVLREVGDLRLALFGLLLLVVVRVLPDGLSRLMLGRRERHLFTPSAAAEAPPAEPARPAAAAERPLLEVRGLSKQFRGLAALSDVSFTVRQGEILGIMGPNGAGKSTCLGMVSGFLKPTAGRVRFDGRDVTGSAPNRIARAGMVRTFQHTTLFEGLTVFESVLIATQSRYPSHPLAAFFRRPSWRRDEARRVAVVWSVLRQVGLEAQAEKLASEMSYGEQRLLAIAVALATRPRLLLLDEPAAGLNPVEAKGLSEVLHGLRRSGLTIVLVEHNVPMMMELCDRLLVVHHGERITEGSPQAVRSDPAVQAAYFGSHEVAPCSK